MKYRLSLLLSLASLVTSWQANATECNPPNQLSTCIDPDNVWPSSTPSRFGHVGGTELTAKGQFGFGLLMTFQKQPISLTLPSSDPAGTKTKVIDNQLNANFLWSWGATKYLELGVSAPVTLYQTGVGTSGATSQTTTPIARSAAKDVRFGATYAIVSRPLTNPNQGLGLVLRTQIAAPVGNQSEFGGGQGFVFLPSLGAEYRIGRWFAAAEAGARLRKETQFATTKIGNQLQGSLGIGLMILPEELLSIQIESSALLGLATQPESPLSTLGSGSTQSSRNVPAEWLATLRTAPSRGSDFSLFGGFGTGLNLTSNDTTEPQYRFVIGARYTPLGRDYRDGDGIPDKDDKCPDQPEDKDGFEDEDGCPDPDNDRDGIPDEKDKCRDAPEDFDGFQDEDGCPDPDDDGDGIPDALDQCRNDPEDFDGFQDEDGCPDPDNDGDGIPDKQDKCPNGPEDVDGFRDEDGCPDPDNDLDGIPDDKDMCPNEAEDKDGFEDEDGCPDPDNDHDGILDADDKCPLVPETINGIDDEDGCPEPNAKDLVVLNGSRIELVNPIKFAAGQAKITKDIETKLKMIAQKARSVDNLQGLILETFADAPGSSSKQETLAIKRADAIKTFLVTIGFQGDQITAAAGDLSAKRPPNAGHVEVTILKKNIKKKVNNKNPKPAK